VAERLEDGRVEYVEMGAKPWVMPRRVVAARAMVLVIGDDGDFMLVSILFMFDTVNKYCCVTFFELNEELVRSKSY